MKKSILLSLTLVAMQTFAFNYDIDENTVIVGKDDTYRVSEEGTTTMEYVAALYKIGLANMIEANPKVDPIVPARGVNLIIPNETILPDAPREGLIINVPELRLYYYNDNKVNVLPIGIGQIGTGTPLDWVTKVERKKANPTWTPTAKMHAEYAARGETLPKVWPAGPDNPMGLYALYIGRLFAIHGTNADFGIGLRVSHGCVRLRNDDIEYLFNNIPVGTRVQFINKPIKTAIDQDGNIFIEVHQPLSMNETDFESMENIPFTFTKAEEEFFKNEEIDQDILKRALDERSGRPVLLNPAEF